MEVRELVEAMSASQDYGCVVSLLETCMAAAPVDGLVLEFGVGSGYTTKALGQMAGRKIYGFDWFHGLPLRWTVNHEAGILNMNGVPPPDLPANVELVIGLFEDTLPDFLEDHLGPVALCHVDCDFYESASFVLRSLRGRLGSGAVVVFNEFWDYVECENHEAKAFSEFLSDTHLRAKCLGRSGRGYTPTGFILEGR